MEHTYRITGTLSELHEILENQFEMEEELARFSVSLLLTSQQQSVNEINDENVALWYLEKHEHFTTPVFKSRFSISFTDAGKEILIKLFIQFGKMLIFGDEFALKTLLNCLSAIYKNGTYIKDEECCVYYQALNWKITHKSQEYFQVQDIMPYNFEKICDHLELIKDKKWKCIKCNNEQCNATEEYYKCILDELCKPDRKVLEKYNEMYRFTK